MTINYIFVNILKCGDTVMEKQIQKDLYLRIKELYVNKKYSTVEKESTKYLDRYPNDINVRFMRARSYRKLGKFKDAIKDLNYILKFGYNDHSILELYFVYYYLNMYKEALELLPILYEKKAMKSYSVSISELVMKKQLGLEIKLKKGSRCDYIRGQILDYSTKETISHLDKHINPTEDNISCFNEGIDIKYLFDVVRYNLDSTKKVNTEEVMDIYYFGISNIGTFKGEICNFIKVIVVPNTKNIISMYPTNNVDYNSVTNLDIEYDKLFKRDNKVKTMSRIDKFNKKYNM